MKAELFNKAIAQIPTIVADMVAWNSPKPRQMYSLSVDYYNPNNICTHSNHFLVEEDDLLDAVKRASKQWDCKVEEVSDTRVVIKRTSTSGNYVIATYKPTKSSGVIVEVSD